MRIPPEHPALMSERWSYDLLNDLPEPVLLWFAADCAAQACFRSEVRSMKMWETIRAVRLCALKQIDEKTLLEYSQLAKTEFLRLFKKSARGMRKSLYKAFKAVVSSSLDGFNAWQNKAPVQLRSVREAAEAAASANASNAHWNITEYRANIWHLARLRYLCEVWRCCGERGLQLLFKGQCPLHWEDVL